MVTKEEVEYEDIFVRIICSCQLSYKTLDKIIHMHYRKLAKSRCMSLFDLRPGYWCFVERLNPSIRMWQSLNYVDIASFKVSMKCCQSNRSLKPLQTYIHFIYVSMFNLVFKF